LLAILRACENLETLDLGWNRGIARSLIYALQKNTVPELRNLFKNLKSLSLYATQLQRSQLLTILGFYKNLETLNLGWNQGIARHLAYALSENTVPGLRDLCKDLKGLNLRDTVQNHLELKTILQFCENLEELQIK